MPPDCLTHVNDLPDNGGTRWPGSNEILGVRTSLSRPLGLTRIGVHRDVLHPGQRSSRPHAELFEEECVYVLSGTPDVIVDGKRFPTRAGSFAAFPPGTGTTHCVHNPSASAVELLVIGERRDHGCLAIRRLLELWSDPASPAPEPVFAEGARYRVAGLGDDVSPELGLALRRKHFGVHPVEAVAELVSWTHATVQWRSAGAEGMAVLQIEVALERSINSVTEYGITT